MLNILCCPKCEGDLTCTATETSSTGKVIEGSLSCENCSNNYPVVRSIPRFVAMENYAASFGYQWNLYKHTQVDHYSKFNHSEERFYAETKWDDNSLRGNWVLDVGCGNGRFVEISSRHECQVVGVDISSAIDAAGELFKDRENVHLIQASIYELPFKKGAFDKVYCIGVIQHTPDPEKSVKTLPKFVKKGGELALTIYERKPWTPLYGKYLVRPLTKRINKKALLLLIKALSPILFPVTEILFRLPLLGRVFKFLIPYANYVDFKGLSIAQRYEWAVLDTFDMLSPAFDGPMNEAEVRACLENVNVMNVKRYPNPGVNVVGVV